MERQGPLDTGRATTAKTGTRKIPKEVKKKTNRCLWFAATRYTEAAGLQELRLFGSGTYSVGKATVLFWQADAIWKFTEMQYRYCFFLPIAILFLTLIRWIAD